MLRAFRGYAFGGADPAPGSGIQITTSRADALCAEREPGRDSLTCTHCGSIAAPSNGVCPSCGRPASSATPDVWPDPLAAPAPLSPTAVLGDDRSAPDHPPTKAMPTSPYGVP